MKYLIASDFDGTIIQNGIISERTLKAIEKFRSKGHFFGISTGRDYEFGYEVFKRDFNLSFDFVVMNNGAACCDSDGNMLFTQYIDTAKDQKNPTLAMRLVNRFIELGCVDCSVSTFNKRLEFHQQHLENGRRDEERHKTYRPISMLEDVCEFVSAEAECESVEKAVLVANIIKEEFCDFFDTMQNGACVDIMPKGISKAVGISRLAKILNVPHDNVWTAGDNNNDKEMLSSFHGCVMTSGLLHLREISEYVCDSVADVIDLVLKNEK